MAPAQVEQDSGYGWFVAVVMCLCFTFSYMDRSVVPLLIQPLEHALALTDTTVALLQGAAFAVFYALFGFPLARLADNGHRRNLILAGVIAWSLATVGCGLARTVPQLFLGRMCVAVGEAVLAPAAVSILADYFSVARRGRALSLYSMGVFFGGGLSLWFGGNLIRLLGPQGVVQTPFGAFETWRIVFMAVGCSGVILVPLLCMVKEPARRSNLGASEPARTSLREVMSVFGQRKAPLAACIVGFALLALGAQTIQTWAPTLFVRIHGWKLAGAGQKLGGFTLALSPLGVVAGALLADLFERRGRRDGKFLVGILSGIGCAVAGLLFTMASERTALLGIAALQFIVAFNFGLVQAALTELLPNRMRAFGSACYVAASNLLAATTGPLLVGLLDDRVFHDPAMIATSIRCVAPASFLLAAAILAWGLKPFRLATADLAPGGEAPGVPPAAALLSRPGPARTQGPFPD